MLQIYLFDILGSPSIGVFMRATEEYLIVPNQIPETKLEKLEDWFHTKAAKVNVGGSVLLGPLICANSNGFILPKYVLDEEIKSLKTLGDINITIAQTRRTAYGNLVLANDHGAVADPRLKKEELRMVRDTLGVEVAQGQVAGLPYVGSLSVATNKGVMAHPLIKPEEKTLIEEMLKVPVEAGTINCGIPYIATGLIGNSKVSVAGSETTGPELAMISEALGVD